MVWKFIWTVNRAQPVWCHRYMHTRPMCGLHWWQCDPATVGGLKTDTNFAWELHVYGSAVLFLLVVVAATFGVIDGANRLHPFCGAFTLANILLLLAGLLRFVQLIIDPYGSRNILPHPALTAWHNLPVPLLLWAQATLALLALREETSPQQLSVTGWLAALHCTSLLLADLLSKTLSPALPLMLQTLTICWGLLLCLGIFSSL